MLIMMLYYSYSYRIKDTVLKSNIHKDANYLQRFNGLTIITYNRND